MSGGQIRQASKNYLLGQLLKNNIFFYYSLLNLGKSEYFTVTKHDINNVFELFADENSFNCVTCVKGSGYISGKVIAQGDSYFIPANYGKYKIKGNLEIILTKV